MIKEDSLSDITLKCNYSKCKKEIIVRLTTKNHIIIPSYADIDALGWTSAFYIMHYCPTHKNTGITQKGKL